MDVLAGLDPERRGGGAAGRAPRVGARARAQPRLDAAAMAQPLAAAARTRLDHRPVGRIVELVAVTDPAGEGLGVVVWLGRRHHVGGWLGCLPAEFQDATSWRLRDNLPHLPTLFRKLP